MANRFASGKHAIAECDRCGFRYKLKELKKLTIKTKQVNIKVCPTCWEPDQPQLQLGMYPVDDPQALREPRPDTSYRQSGFSGLRLTTTPTDSPNAFGTVSEGSRVTQWGWNPVGFGNGGDYLLAINDLEGLGQVGTVTITIT